MASSPSANGHTAGRGGLARAGEHLSHYVLDLWFERTVRPKHEDAAGSFATRMILWRALNIGMKPKHLRRHSKHGWPNLD